MMSIRALSRPLHRTSMYQNKAFNILSRSIVSERIISVRNKSSRSIDVSKIFQAQSQDTINSTDSVRPSYEVLDKCPDPECPCAAMPDMPDGLPVDKESKMAGKMPYYDRHVVTTVAVSLNEYAESKPQPTVESIDLHTAALDWPSKLESDPKDLVTILKSYLGPKGTAYRSDFATSVTASTISSLPNLSRPPGMRDDFEEVLVFPDFVRLRVRRAPPSKSDHEPMASFFSSSSTSIDLPSLARLVTDNAHIQQNCASYSPITKPVVLICGHAKRDARCGILGPLLLSQFHRVLGDRKDDIHLGLVSHIGGHKFAGNVVVYMPPNASHGSRYEGHYGNGNASRTFASTPIDGMGVWYGRVEPKHVEGIVNQTIRSGKVISELLRGVHDFGGAIYK